MELASTPPAPTTAFWVESRRSDAKRYQSLVETWRVHDRHILQPWGGLLRHFSLTPRVLQDGKVVWGDLSIPTYDVVRVAPVSIYTIKDGCSTARARFFGSIWRTFCSLTIARHWQHSSSSVFRLETRSSIAPWAVAMASR